ncbi:MAG TPA: FAD binding domain-containing protein [Spirochaetota bacterium]|nr:FAD binding domain-containing protein [Spirochaetota bacterium]
MLEFLLNHQIVSTDQPPGKVVLDYVRRDERKTGTKEGCKEGECGACTVLLGCLEDGKVVYRNVASCLVPLGDAAGRHIVTIEGVNKPDGSLNPVQQAFVDEGATQCGFCTPGFIMSLTAFFLNSPDLALADALDAVDGNVCRCTGHVAIRKAIENLCTEYRKRLDPGRDRLEQLIEWGIVQPWMRDVPARLGSCAVAQPAREQGSVFVAGGTDAFVQKPEALRNAKLSFLSQRPELSYIREEGDVVVMGGGTTVEDVRRSAVFQAIFPDTVRNMTLVSSTIMRNRATIAGNIVNASPIADMAIMLLVLGCSLDIEAHDGKKREVRLDALYKGYKQLDLLPGELITAIRFPRPGASSRYSFEKVSQREFLDIASANTALLVGTDGKTINRAVVSAGGVGPVPMLLTKTGDALAGKPLAPATIRAAAAVLDGEIAPIDDVRGTAGYKRTLLRQLFFAHWIKLFPEQFSLEALA